jgi:hypothetical protein
MAGNVDTGDRHKVAQYHCKFQTVPLQWDTHYTPRDRGKLIHERKPEVENLVSDLCPGLS